MRLHPLLGPTANWSSVLSLAQQFDFVKRKISYQIHNNRSSSIFSTEVTSSISAVITVSQVVVILPPLSRSLASFLAPDYVLDVSQLDRLRDYDHKFHALGYDNQYPRLQRREWCHRWNWQLPSIPGVDDDTSSATHPTTRLFVVQLEERR